MADDDRVLLIAPTQCGMETILNEVVVVAVSRQDLCAYSNRIFFFYPFKGAAQFFSLSRKTSLTPMKYPK